MVRVRARFSQGRRQVKKYLMNTHGEHGTEPPRGPGAKPLDEGGSEGEAS